MQNFYDIVLPINVNRLFTYSSEMQLKRGIRVLVNFNNKLYTGIVWSKNNLDSYDFKVNKIHEVIDKKPILTNDLIKLSNWMHEYYHVPLGIVLNNIIPRGLKLELQKKVIFLEENEEFIASNKDLSMIYNFLKEKKEWLDLTIVKDIIKEKGFHNKIERLEENKLILINHSYEKKIKPKQVNYIKILQCKPKQLTLTQRNAFNIIKQHGDEFPLSKVSKSISYYMIKKLKEKKIISLICKKTKIKSIYEERSQEDETYNNIELTNEQQNVLDEINYSASQKLFCTYLLHGITGSGKTEVYLRAIKQVLESGRTALILVPEISLTPQLFRKFKTYFKDKNLFAILHSNLSDREKANEWKRIRNHKARIIFGVRSAIFAPLEDLGLIIVDEEHETSYKQDNPPRYNARDLAVLRGKLNNSTVILGSATPSIETLNNVDKKKYKLLTLSQRPSGVSSPSIKIIDMKEVRDKFGIFSREMIDNIEKNISNKDQTILLMNRRGYSSYIQCSDCGETFKCSNCDVSLKYHKQKEKLICHYCGETTSIPRKCPVCNSYKFNFGAPGTEQLEKQLNSIFPKNKILRMDTDTTNKKDSYQNMYRRMMNNEVDILLGTQMIAKGLDFPNVTLVGVLSADVGLNIPNYRAAERIYQQLVQVSGRAGRSKKKGRVLIQTYNPDNYVLNNFIEQDYLKFIGKELKNREAFFYPPYSKLGRIVFSSANKDILEAEMEKLSAFMERVNTVKKNKKIQILGPIESYFYKLNKRYRFHIILKTDTILSLHKILNFLDDKIKIKSTIKIDYDIDPLSLL